MADYTDVLNGSGTAPSTGPFTGAEPGPPTGAGTEPQNGAPTAPGVFPTGGPASDASMTPGSAADMTGRVSPASSRPAGAANASTLVEGDVSAQDMAAPTGWRALLKGALIGMSAGSQIKQGQGGFFAGMGAGAGAQMQNQMQEKEQTAKIKFQNAQAANMVAEAAIRDKQLHSYDQTQQDVHNAASLDTVERLARLGIRPDIAVANTGEAAHAGLEQVTATHGAVPPLFTVNVGDKVLSYNLNDLSAKPAILAEVNRARKITNPSGVPIDEKTWQAMPPTVQAQMTYDALNFSAPDATEANLLRYKNYRETALQQADSPEKETAVAGLDSTIKRLTGTLDSEKKRMLAQKEEETKATGEYQKNLASAAEAKAHGALFQAQADQLNTAMRQGKQVELIPEVKDKIASLPVPQQQVLAQYDSNTQAALMSVAFGNGEVDFGKNFPSRLNKGAPGLNAQQALGAIKQINPDWSEQTYKVKADAYKNATSTKPNSLGGQAGSLNNFIGHAAQVREEANKFYNEDPKLYKKTLSALRPIMGQERIAALSEAISVVNGEFNNLIKAGYAPTELEVRAQEAIMKPTSTFGEINAALSVMGHMATTRVNTMNQQYHTATGADFPNLIYGDNIENAKKLGIPVERYRTGGRVGSSGTAPQMQQSAEAGQQASQPAKKVGDVFMQNGHQYTVTSVDANGKITGAN